MCLKSEKCKGIRVHCANMSWPTRDVMVLLRPARSLRRGPALSSTRHGRYRQEWVRSSRTSCRDAHPWCRRAGPRRKRLPHRSPFPRRKSPPGHQTRGHLRNSAQYDSTQDPRSMTMRSTGQRTNLFLKSAWQWLSFGGIERGSFKRVHKLFTVFCPVYSGGIFLPRT